MEQKFLDKEGVKVLWRQASLKDYPNNETLMAVIDAIDETKADKDELFSKSWNDLIDKPFYEEISEEIILEETTVEIDSSLYTQVSNTSHFIEGDTYLVTYNGTEYECVAYGSVFNHAPTILLGNATLLELTGGNGEPFVFDSYNDNTIYFNVSSAGSYTISIVHYNSKIHKIDDKFVNATGQKVSGNTYIIDGENEIAKVGAEIFNDYVSNINTGAYSHVEGFNNTNTGNHSHIEGLDNINTYNYNHVEGHKNISNSFYSHVEGAGNKSNNNFIHVEGVNNIAYGYAQHVQGKSNIEDTEGKYAHIVGNGTVQIHNNTNEYTGTRSNAHTLDWNGNAWFAGDVYVGSTSGTNKDTGSKKLATEDYVATELSDYYLKTEVDTLHTEIEDYVDNQVAALVNSAPETLDTLGELAAAFEENKEVVEALDASITNKQDKVSDTLILVDTVTGIQHKIQIQNGQLVSFPVE